jgi:hypothetical protein
MTDATAKWLARLRDELAWLRETHPEKTALIGAAEGHLETVRRAGAYPAALTHPPAVERLVTPNT